jgi:hypothetical protein
MPRNFLHDCNIVKYISSLEIFQDFPPHFLIPFLIILIFDPVILHIAGRSGRGDFIISTLELMKDSPCKKNQAM